MAVTLYQDSKPTDSISLNSDYFLACYYANVLANIRPVLSPYLLMTDVSLEATQCFIWDGDMVDKSLAGNTESLLHQSSFGFNKPINGTGEDYINSSSSLVFLGNFENTIKKILLKLKRLCAHLVLLPVHVLGIPKKFMLTCQALKT